MGNQLSKEEILALAAKYIPSVRSTKQTDEEVAAEKDMIENLSVMFTQMEDAWPGCAPFIPGRFYHFRTVTNYWTGRLLGFLNGFLILDNASWVAETGKFGPAINTAKFSEYECIDPKRMVSVARDSIVDGIEIDHLPTDGEKKSGKDNDDE